jgi:hypothetical protein
LQAKREERLWNSKAVMSCNGLVIDSDNFQIVAYPYNQVISMFFKKLNFSKIPLWDDKYVFGKPSEKETDWTGIFVEFSLDWNHTKVYEKLDGKLAILYHYAGAWHVASTNTPDSSELIQWDSGRSYVVFRELFWDLWYRFGYSLPNPEEKYIFFIIY